MGKILKAAIVSLVMVIALCVTTTIAGESSYGKSAIFAPNSYGKCATDIGETIGITVANVSDSVQETIRKTEEIADESEKLPTIPDDDYVEPENDYVADYTLTDINELAEGEIIPDRGYIPNEDYILRVITAEGGSDELICAGVTQCLFNACERDGWNRTVEQILNDYQYTGPASWISDAAEKAWDEIFCSGYSYPAFEDALYFYSTRYCYSSWHETQRFVIEVNGVRFFARWD